MSLSLAALNTPEHLLLTTFRLFMMACREPEERHPDWRGGLQAAGLNDQSTEACGALCGIVASTAVRPISIHGGRCFCVSKDEVHFLRLVGLLQRGQLQSAADALAEWLPPAAARIAMTPGLLFATSLKDRELRLPLRHPQMTMPYPGHLVHTNAGMMLVQ